MALAENKLKSVPLNNSAANSINDSTETQSAGNKIFTIALVLGIVVGIAITYSIMQVTVVRSLENSVVFEQAQKTAYITANELDFETVAPRLKALEISNAAKSEKEIILVNTISSLQESLKSASKKVLEVELLAEEQIKAAKIAAIKALQE